MQDKQDSTVQPQPSEPSSESNDSLNIIEAQRNLADRATVISSITGRGRSIADALDFGPNVLERMEHDNQSTSTAERVGCAVVGELAQCATLVVGEGASLHAAVRSGRSWGASNPGATAACATPELAVTFAGIATTIDIARNVGNSAERLCHIIVQAPSIPPSFPEPSTSHSDSSITLLDNDRTSLPIRTTCNTRQENIPARELSLFGESIAVPRVTASYSLILQSLHPGASSILSFSRESVDNTSINTAASTTIALPTLDNQLSSEWSATSSTSLDWSSAFQTSISPSFDATSYSHMLATLGVSPSGEGQVPSCADLLNSNNERQNTLATSIENRQSICTSLLNRDCSLRPGFFSRPGFEVGIGATGEFEMKAQEKPQGRAGNSSDYGGSSSGRSYDRGSHWSGVDGAFDCSYEYGGGGYAFC